MTTEIHKKVIQIIGAVHAPKDEITATTLVKDLGIDEHDRLELIMRLEDQFRICIDDEKFNNLQSVNHIAEYLKSINS